MKTRKDMIWDAHCAFIATGENVALRACFETARATVDAFERDWRKVEMNATAPAPDPVRAAAVAFVDARNMLGVVSSDRLREDGKSSSSPEWAAFYAAHADLLDAVAAERGADAKRVECVNAPMLGAMYWTPPAPNWRALVEELRDACNAQNNWFAREDDWSSDESKRCARAVSALIAALDKPEGAPPRRDDFKSALHQLSERVFETATLRKERDELSAALEATRKELAEAKAERTALRGQLDYEIEAMDEVREILVAGENESTDDAARRVMSELAATRKELSEARDALARVLPETRKSLGAPDTELTWAAARRVVAEREKAVRMFTETAVELGQTRTERDELRAKLAVLQAKCDSIKPIDVVFDGPPSHTSGRFVEVEDMQGRSLNLGYWIDRGDGMWALRFDVLTAAKDAAAKNGGV